MVALPLHQLIFQVGVAASHHSDNDWQPFPCRRISTFIRKSLDRFYKLVGNIRVSPSFQNVCPIVLHYPVVAPVIPGDRHTHRCYDLLLIVRLSDNDKTLVNQAQYVKDLLRLVNTDRRIPDVLSLFLSRSLQQMRDLDHVPGCRPADLDFLHVATPMASDSDRPAL